MSPLECEHAEPLRTRQVCAHLLDSAELDYCKLFFAESWDPALICSEDCAKSSEPGHALVRICPQCFATIEAERCWDEGDVGVIGRPDPRVRAEQLRFVHEPIADVDPQLACASKRGWVIRETSGRLVRLAPSGLVELPIPKPLETLELGRHEQLLVSPCGRWAALADHHTGMVWELDSGGVTLELTRGDYHTIQTSFPLAFVEHWQRSVLVHATDWNRLDLFDLDARRCISERPVPQHQRERSNDDHYLDYFHGRLLPSPKFTRVADGGWVWAPYGIVTAWSLTRWLEEDPWESEDGPSKVSFAQRGYSWNETVCWLDEDRLTVWGYGNDDLNLIPAVEIYDVRTAKLDRWFPGPERGALCFDGRWLLSAAADGPGVSAWDIASGERVASDPSCQFLAWDPSSGRMLTRVAGHLCTSRL